MSQIPIAEALRIALRHHQAGQLSQAESIYRRVLARQPDHPDALHYLGVLIGEGGHYDQAVELIGRAIAVRPLDGELHSSIGGYFVHWGKLDEGIAALRRAIELKPNHANAHANLGGALKLKGRLDEAVAVLRRAVEIKPDYADAHYNLGTVLYAKGDLDGAAVALQRALDLRGDHLQSCDNLGSALSRQGCVDKALACYDRMIARMPQNPDMLSNRLFLLHFLPSCDAKAIEEEHRRWDRLFAQPLRPLISPHANDRAPSRRLKIGYVSPDLRFHSVAHFLLPLIEAHDRSQVHITCYSTSRSADEVTARFQQNADEWRNLADLSDEQAASIIRHDAIDILVDLAGHTGGHRLLLFARKPAPIQVSYLGYPGTTGLATIDYRLSDAWADPPGESDAHCSETIVRLPETAWCFKPLSDSFEVGDLPARRNGFITFGTFNNFAKINPDLLEWWARLLQHIPGSHLLLKNGAMRNESTLRRLREFFAARGIATERLELIPWEDSIADHMPWYNRLDIALDTFPYHGTTTTCEALWMGVPVVTLAGGTHASRVGASLLSNAGLPSLIAQSSADYVRIAADLAADPSRLQNFRASLRSQLQQSFLMDAPRFARNVEAAFRTMWQQWCSSKQ